VVGRSAGPIFLFGSSSIFFFFNSIQKNLCFLRELQATLRCHADSSTFSCAWLITAAPVRLDRSFWVMLVLVDAGCWLVIGRFV
jgi:hypothetical protein